jgi:hypothetical protein
MLDHLALTSRNRNHDVIVAKSGLATPGFARRKPSEERDGPPFLRWLSIKWYCSRR